MSTASIRQRNRRYIDVLQQAKDARTDAVFTFGWLDGGVTGVRSPGVFESIFHV